MQDTTVGLWIIGWSLVGLAIVGLYAIVSTVLDELASRRAVARLPVLRSPMPQLYPGCVTCEAAPSSQSLCRHQGRDHSDGIRW